MRVRRILINSSLGLAVGAVATVGVTSVVSARTTTPVGQAVAVTRGRLVATVTATGNVEAVNRTQVDLTSAGGTVTRIHVREGARVTKGQRLLKVDDTSEKRDLRTARASLASAQAKLTTTTQPRSPAQVRQDEAAVSDAEQSVRNAETSLKDARATRTLDEKQQDAVVDDADDALSSAEHELDDAESDLSDAKDQLAEDQQAGDTSAVSADQSAVSSLTSAVRSTESAVDSAESTKSAAKRTRSATLLKDQQAVNSAKGQLATAHRQLEQQRAAAAVSAQPARTGEVDDAHAQIDSAQVDVDQAEQALADTVLTAPEDGTVATINAVVGQSSSSAPASDSSSGSGGGASSSSGGSSGAGASTTGSSSSSSSSGLVVLTDLTHKQISATVAEVEVTRLKRGLTAQMVFPASGVTAAGTVSAIDTEETMTDNVVEYGVKVAMDSKDTAVKVGQTATLTITVEQKENVLVVPTSALRTVDGHSAVSRRINDVDSPVTVQTGLVGTTGTEITSGLAEGDQVVLPTSGGS